MKKITILLVLLSITTYGQLLDVTGNLPQYGFGFSAWGDFDGDGDLDLYYAGDFNGVGSGGLFVYDNENFTLLTTSGLPAYSLGAADWGDFDGDGDLDIIISGYDPTIGNGGSGVADIYINNGNQTFTALNAGLPPVYMGDARFTDLDGDGDLDVAIGGTDLGAGADLVKLYKNNGDTTLTEIAVTFPPLNIPKIKFADYDNDGNVDLAVSGFNSSTNSAYAKIWKNTGNLNYTEQSLGLPQIWLGDLEWADIDADGDLDLVITGAATTESEAHLLLNNNDGTFTDDPHFNITGGHREAVIELADFNQDGSLDIFIAGFHSSNGTDYLFAKLYDNNGSGIFTENTNNTFVPVHYADGDAADYDNDGKVDLFYTGEDANFFGIAKLYHNGPTAGIQNTAIEGLNLYPNPAHEVLYIQNENNNPIQITIADITGKSIYQNTANTTLSINVSNYPAGIYLIKIVQGNQTMNQKLIIK